MGLLVGGIIGLPIGAATGFISGAATYQIKTGKFQDLMNGDVGSGAAVGIVGFFLGAVSGTICGGIGSKQVNSVLLGGLFGGLVGGLASGTFIGMQIN